MENKPKISVIIPVYNTEEYVERCLETVLNQSYNNIEIIIVMMDQMTYLTILSAKLFKIIKTLIIYS